jgi:hypothetical protein
LFTVYWCNITCCPKENYTCFPKEDDLHIVENAILHDNDNDEEKEEDLPIVEETITQDDDDEEEDLHIVEDTQ